MKQIAEYIYYLTEADSDEDEYDGEGYYYEDEYECLIGPYDTQDEADDAFTDYKFYLDDPEADELPDEDNYSESSDPEVDLDRI